MRCWQELPFPRLAWPPYWAPIFPFPSSGHSIRLLGGLTELEAKLSSTFIPEGQLDCKILSYCCLLVFSACVSLQSHPGHPAQNRPTGEPLINVLLTCQTESAPPMCQHGARLQTVHLFCVLNCNSSSGFRITGPSIATKKNHSDANMHLVSKHTYLFTHIHTGTFIPPLRLCTPTSKQARQTIANGSDSLLVTSDQYAQAYWSYMVLRV